MPMPAMVLLLLLPLPVVAAVMVVNELDVAMLPDELVAALAGDGTTEVVSAAFVVGALARVSFFMSSP